MKPAEVRVETNWSPTTLNGSSHATPLDAKSENAMGLPISMATYISRMPIRNSEILMSIFLMSMNTTTATAAMATRYITISMSPLFLSFSYCIARSKRGTRAGGVRPTPARSPYQSHCAMRSMNQAQNRSESTPVVTVAFGSCLR